MNSPVPPISSKRAERGVRWEFNRPLLLWSLLGLFIGLGVLSALYLFQSKKIARTFLERAAVAEREEAWESQIEWLSRYRLLFPEDFESQRQLAIACDRAVESPPENLLANVTRARTQLRNALVQAEKMGDDRDLIYDLRQRYIPRLLQSGAYWAKEAETQIILLNPSAEDPQALRWLALARMEQSSTSDSLPLQTDSEKPPINAWQALAQQPLGLIVLKAWKANQDDLNLAAYLLELCATRPASFVSDQEPSKSQAASSPDAQDEFNIDPKQLAAQVAKHLSAFSESGQAQWIVYRYRKTEAPRDALAELMRVTPAALARLQQSAERIASKESSVPGPRVSGPLAPIIRPDNKYRPQWDFELVLRCANDVIEALQSKSERQTAREQLDALIDLPDLSINPISLESTYLLRSNEYWLDNQREKAEELCTAGIQRLGDDSLRLQIVRTSSLAALGSLEDATNATQSLSQLIERRSKALIGPAGANLSQSMRQTLQKDMDTASWSLQLFLGQITLREDRLQQAMVHLQGAMESQLTIPDAERLRATELAATTYSRLELWDLAGVAFERAVLLSTEDDRFRILAAQAWNAAGNAQRANQQLKAIEGNSLGFQLVRAEALVKEQLAKPPTLRNFADALRAVDKARLLFKQTEPKPTQDSTGDEQAQANTERTLMEAQLEVLSLIISGSKDDERHQQALERLNTFAEQHPNQAELQSLVALSFAASGQNDRAQAAMQRLQDTESADSFLYQTTSARLAAIQGDFQASIDQLLKHAETHPQDAVKCLMLAADTAQAQGQFEQVSKILQKLPSTNQTPEILFRLFSISLAQGLETKDKPSETATETMKSPAHWEAALRDREGPLGTWWRLAQASILLAQWDQLAEDASERVTILRQTEILRDELRKARPRWGFTHSLEGQIAARRGETLAAIDALRRGIENGDQRTASLLLMVSLLIKSDRVAEAEAEFSRLNQQNHADSSVVSLAMALGSKQGKFQEGLTWARSGSVKMPRDANAWMLLAQAAMLAASSTDEPQARQDLIDETQDALDRALKISNAASLPVFELRIRFRKAFFGTTEVRQELQRAMESKVPEPSRSLFVGASFLDLQSPEEALPVLSRAVRAAPQNPDGYLAMSDYYRAIRDDSKSIEMLEKAFSLGNARPDIRNRLALAIALRDGADVPWHRLDQILANETKPSSSNKLLHALILINRGDEERQKQAATMLREMIQQNDASMDDAMRMLAALERRRWAVAKADPESKEAARALSEARRLYTLLTRRSDPAAMDLFRLADLLDQADILEPIEALATQLDKLPNASSLALDLRLRLAKKLGQEDRAVELVRAWAQSTAGVNGLDPSNTWDAAGRALSRLGLHQEALDWLQKAYQENANTLPGYVLGLSRAKKFGEAIEICKSHYVKTNQPEAVALIADVLVMSGNMTEVPEELEATFREALQKHESSAKLIESLATLRLAQRRPSDAVFLYERAEKLAPKDVRVLNNLAMALSEIPDRAPEAIARSQKAIDLYGRSPELLDTHGIVLLRNSNVPEATKYFREATASSNDPRYRLHLLMAIKRSGDKTAALREWNKLDQKKLQASILTPGDRRDLQALEQEFSRKSGGNQ